MENKLVTDNKKIAKNTFMLYTRQIMTVIVSLYSVRVVLNTLGVEDYGIYNVIAGLVALFSFLKGTMASATQRFFSFALGKKDESLLKRTFTVNLIIYATIAILAYGLLETVGLWFVNNYLEIPEERMVSAIEVFHFSALTFVAQILMTPFMAIIIAHEDMVYYAYISIAEVLLKLAIVFLLIFLPGDKLELYGMLLCIVSFLISFIYMMVCFRKYNECQVKKLYWDKKLLKEITGFTGWTLFGQISVVSRNQGITVLLNQMFNPVTVAARAIAMNVASQINMFSNNFNLGLYPPIIKSYATGNKKLMFSYIFNGSKITFSLMWIFALPLLIEMEMVLGLWLKNPPDSAVLFTRLALTEVLINSISLPLITAARAPGKMMGYELSLGMVNICIFVAAWLILNLGYSAYSVFIVAIVANVIMFVIRLVIVRKLINLSIIEFSRKVMGPILKIICISSFCALLTKKLVPVGYIYSFVNILLVVIFTMISIYYIGLDKEWRAKVKSMIHKKLSLWSKRLL